jgi:hypothetical protein
MSQGRGEVSMMKSETCGDGHRTCAFEPSSDVVQFETRSSLVSSYGILRDCAERLRQAGTGSNQFEARRLTTPKAAASTMLIHSYSQTNAW